MNIYFGDFVTTVSTLMICAAIAYIVYTSKKHKQIEFWGRRIALLALFGLVLCCFAATRDSYHLSVEKFFDIADTAGVFAFDSLQSILCCIGGTIIAFRLFQVFLSKVKNIERQCFLCLAQLLF